MSSSFAGVILNIRRPSRALLFISLKRDDDDGVNALLQILLTRETSSRFDTLASLLRVGCEITGVGEEASTTPSQHSTCVTLLARDVMLRSLIVRDAVRSVVVGVVTRLVLRVTDGSVPVTEAADAIRVSPLLIIEAAAKSAEGIAALVTAMLPPTPSPNQPRRTRIRRPRFTSDELEALHLFETIASPLYDIIEDVFQCDEIDAITKLLGAAHPVARNNNNISDDDIATTTTDACARPSARIPTRALYATLKKGPQIDWIICFLKKICRRQRGNEEEGGGGESPTLPFFDTVIDIGGGRGDLCLAVASAFPHISVILIDVNIVALEHGRNRATALNLTNLSFHSELPLELVTASRSHSLFLGLHTCGGLTDAVITSAIKAKASFIIVPCCYGRMRATSLSCGSVRDATNILPACFSTVAAPTKTAIDTVLRIAESCTDRELALRAMHALCTLRLNSSIAERTLELGDSLIAERTLELGDPLLHHPHHPHHRHRHHHFQTALHAFNCDASPRNLVLTSLLIIS